MTASDRETGLALGVVCYTVGLPRRKLGDVPSSLVLDVRGISDIPPVATDVLLGNLIGSEPAR